VNAVVEALENVRDAHAGDTPAIASPKKIVTEPEVPVARPSNPVAPERFAVLQALLAAHLERPAAAKASSSAAKRPAASAMARRWPAVPAAATAVTELAGR
jgi:hypothetical protein